MLKPRFAPEPPFSHGQAPKTGVLLCNLGTPDAPTAAALRPYLAEFLGDPRVVEIPRLLWLLILHGIILRVRPAKSAHKYASIWTPEGSPLKVHTERQAVGLQSRFDQAGQSVLVRSAMTYGQPAIARVLDEMRQQGVTRVLVLPAYPQYSGTTTAAVFDRIHQWSMRTRLLPEWRFVNRYHDDAGYMGALAQSVRRHWQQNGQAGVLVMSFHGVPERTLMQGDPYHCECHKTARLLAEALGLSRDQYRVTFQSRFGKAKWLEPYTDPTVRELARNGTERVDVICPGFTSDCLETLEEIAMEVRTAFIEEGGREFHYIPCLNDDATWLDALYGVTLKHMQGWPTASPTSQELAASRAAALGLGAKD
ncbi:MAG: ferrochelatase [Alphaproteobacteria bacterium]|nr:ferrochelatase [Alphaproteobacteria bacterium]